MYIYTQTVHVYFYANFGWVDHTSTTSTARQDAWRLGDGGDPGKTPPVLSIWGL